MGRLLPRKNIKTLLFKALNTLSYYLLPRYRVSAQNRIYLNYIKKHKPEQK